jgi:hypothetical protein
MFPSTYIYSILTFPCFLWLLHQINRDGKEKERENRKNRGHDHYIFYNLKARKEARYVI